MLGSKKNQFFFYSTPLLVFLLVPLIVRASELQYTPLAPLTDSQAGHAISLTSYLPFMFTLLIGVSALLAMVMIVVGGITYMTTDVFSTKSSGRGMMTSAVYGLLFVLSSYMILYTINPDLLSFKLSFVGLKGAEWGGGVTVPDTPTTPTTEAGCASWGGNWVVTPNTDAMSSVGGPSIGSCVGGTPPTVPNQDGTIISPSISSGVDKLNAQARSQDTYSGQCALYVRQALAAEGYIDLNGDHPTAAAGYGPYLTKDGFTSVAQNSQGGYLPRAGDVVVIQPPLVNDPSGGSGHIAMYNGSNWVSDTTQSQFLPARSASSPWQSASYQVYRPKN
jgi:hypothetical protein